MSKFDEQYIDLCERILRDGEKVTEDTKIDPKKFKKMTSADAMIPVHKAQVEKAVTTYRLPHQILQFDLSEEFPILTTKKVFFKTAVLEMLWIYQVQSNDVRWLHDRGIKIWDEWEIGEDGKYQGRDFGKEFAHTIGTAYGWIVNRYQLTQNLIETIKTVPHCRRMIMSLWQNEWLKTAALPSCVWNSQWNVLNGKLNMMVTVRSNDVPLGMPFNVTQYAVLCHLLAHVTGLKPGQMTYVINDAHIYENQIDGIKEQIRRRDEKIAKDGKLFDAPKLWINPDVKDFFMFDNSKKCADIKLIDYEHQGVISMPVTE
ncbi:MAG: thymidylate synthase [Candidatus Saccharibacteria bacterium]|nr:thymidylate synthase [Candidatus Saccharibacteria bacterium]